MSAPVAYGAWPSPLTAADVAGATIALSWPRLVGEDVWWREGRPAEGGRNTIVRRCQDGSVEELLSAPWDARSRVHEYGGNPWTVIDGALIFVDFADQRLWRMHPGEDPVALTDEPDEPASARYAELLPVGDELWCLRELHAAGQVSRALVAVALDGSGLVRELVSGSNFLAHPRLSPDGRHLAWLAWDHPNLPWDGTELRIAPVDGGNLGPWRRVAGGPTESVLQPEWLDASTLSAVTDRSGWWNLVRIDMGGNLTELHPVDEEFAGPLWVLGLAWYAVFGDGRIITCHGHRLGMLSPDGSLVDFDLPFTSWLPVLHSDGDRVALVASSATRQQCVVVVDGDGRMDVVHESAAVPVGDEWLPAPSRETFPSADGRVVHALVYSPTSPEVRAPAHERPPYIVFVHGGPTSQTEETLDLEIVFFTSRGIGVIDVDYGGSTGYGRPYRETLRGQWGVVDVEDCVAAARGLAAAGRADGARLAIRGGSAGGWTVLAALTGTDAFAAGASYYGVADLLRMAEDTHDFESRYLDGLVGPLPQARHIYEERAPVNRVDGLSCPVLLLQGAEDRVVPPSQAELFRDALQRKHIRHAYLLFEGEQHGFRRAETIVAALEAELSFYGQVLGFEPPGVPRLTLS